MAFAARRVFAFFAAGLVLLSVCFTTHRYRQVNEYEHTPSTSWPSPVDQSSDALERPPHRVSSNPSNTMTAIIAIDSDPDLFELLSQLIFTKPSALSEVIIICPAIFLTKVRQNVHKFSYQLPTEHHVDIIIRPWSPHLSHAAIFTTFFQEISTDWILILDHSALRGFNTKTRLFLLNPVEYSIPYGPRGFQVAKHSMTCLITSETPQVATYLQPPFLVKTRFASQLDNIGSVGSWHDLGSVISHSNAEAYGGIVVGPNEDNAWCYSADDDTPASETSTVDFAVILPGISELEMAGNLLCGLSHRGYDLRIAILTSVLVFPSGNLQCALAFDVVQTPTEIMEWLSALEVQPNVLLTVAEMKLPLPILVARTTIALPRQDLPRAGWMSVLSPFEWRSTYKILDKRCV
jgi:hypothetical protein